MAPARPGNIVGLLPAVHCRLGSGWQSLPQLPHRPLAGDKLLVLNGQDPFNALPRSPVRWLPPAIGHPLSTIPNRDDASVSCDCSHRAGPVAIGAYRSVRLPCFCWFQPLGLLLLLFLCLTYHSSQSTAPSQELTVLTWPLGSPRVLVQLSTQYP